MISDKDKLSKSLGDSIMKVKMQEALQKYKERLEKQQLLLHNVRQFWF